jgi:zinc protease
MTRLYAGAACLAALLCGPSLATGPQKAPLSAAYERFELDNGLTVVLHRDPKLPMVSVNVWYHVGSAHEGPGRTGFAHLFEHLMFEGSAHVPEGAFDVWLEQAGGQNNGSTNQDRTNYYEDLPAGALELALFLESDRMGYLLDTMTPARVDGQRDVVKNERRQSYENRPYGEASLVLTQLLYPKGHPYSWPVIGSMEDLTAASRDDVAQFFRRYYGPNNASLVVAGDIDLKEAKAAVTRWFQEIPRGQDQGPLKPEPVQLAKEKHHTLEDDVQLPKVILAWPTVPLFHEHDAALDVLASVLGGGKSSRLYKRLVYDMQAAQSVQVYHSSQHLAGHFGVEIVARPGRTLEELVRVIDEEIARAKKDGATEREVQRVKNQLEAHAYESFESIGGFGGRADHLNLYLFHRDEPDSFAWDLARYERLEALRVKEVAAAYLGEGRVRIDVLPKTKDKTAAAAPGGDR